MDTLRLIFQHRLFLFFLPYIAKTPGTLLAKSRPHLLAHSINKIFTGVSFLMLVFHAEFQCAQAFFCETVFSFLKVLIKNKLNLSNVFSISQ
jgi:hypothetical protein